uniref:Uncharacterized protein n=1 Tax=Romanomermis culicivorax TaxID=13658 RepID=A0A915KH04_ROMCU
MEQKTDIYFLNHFSKLFGDEIEFLSFRHPLKFWGTGDPGFKKGAEPSPQTSGLRYMYGYNRQQHVPGI